MSQAPAGRKSLAHAARGFWLWPLLPLTLLLLPSNESRADEPPAAPDEAGQDKRAASPADEPPAAAGQAGQATSAAAAAAEPPAAPAAAGQAPSTTQVAPAAATSKPAAAASAASVPPPDEDRRPPLPACPPLGWPGWPPHHSGGNAPVAVLAGRQPRFEHPLAWGFGDRCMKLVLAGSLNARLEGSSAFVTDRYGSRLDPALGFAPQIRIGGLFDTGLELEPIMLRLEYEHDVLTGIISGDPTLEGESSALPGDALPFENSPDHHLRKAYVRVALGPAVALSLGYQTSHWGLGLLANDGAHGWQPGSARFSDPRGGDRVLRSTLSTGPHSGAGVLLAVGGDLLDGDFLADDDVLLPGDHAVQLIAAAQVGAGQPHGVGLYVVRRHQEAEDGRSTDVTAADLTGRTSLDLGPARLSLELEVAVITGTSELAATVDRPEHDVLQLGAAFRAGLDAGYLGSVLDVLYASGDQNLDDAEQNAFKADPNYDLGLLLFRTVLAGQTGRGVATAGDPTLVGVPSGGTERIATQGSATNAVAVFPRLWVRPLDGLEAYGGPLVAFSVVPLLDPFNAKLAGGVVRNALDGEGSRYLGLELDLGLRYRTLLEGTELEGGVEFGVLWPGSAFVAAGGTGMDTVVGGRGILGYRL